MSDRDRRTTGLAMCLAALAGYVDALGFISLGGFFVSFMTGNTTRLGIELAGWQAGGVAVAGGILLLFVGGVMLGSLIGHAAGKRRKPAVLAFVTLCLAAAALLQTYGMTTPAIGLLTIAMGSENAVFERDGEVTIGLTYMTGTLVKMGQRLAAALLGGPKLAFLLPFLLWGGLLCGTIAGAAAYNLMGMGAIWLAAALSLALTVLAIVLRSLD